MLQDSYTKNISHHWVNLMLSFVLCILQRTKTQEKDHLKQLSGQFIKMSLYQIIYIIKIYYTVNIQFKLNHLLMINLKIKTSGSEHCSIDVIKLQHGNMKTVLQRICQIFKYYKKNSQTKQIDI